VKHKAKAIPVEQSVVDEPVMVLVSVQQLARMATPQAIEALISALDDRSYRVAAAIALLDRGWGRPAQSVDLNVRKTVREMSDEELMAIAAGGTRQLTDARQDTPEASHTLPSAADVDVLDEDNQ
jgi:HEAT repeat protein